MWTNLSLRMRLVLPLGAMIVAALLLGGISLQLFPSARLVEEGEPASRSAKGVAEALNSALLAQGVATSQMVSTVFDGIARHTPEGYGFAQRAAEAGFREAVRERDEPYGDHKRAQFE